MCLTDKAAHYIRHVVYYHKISTDKIYKLVERFYLVAMLGRPLTLSSTPTLRYRFQRLYMIDGYLFHTKFENYMTAPHEKRDSSSVVHGYY
jgi:hypothetical protein